MGCPLSPGAVGAGHGLGEEGGRRPVSTEGRLGRGGDGPPAGREGLGTRWDPTPRIPRGLELGCGVATVWIQHRPGYAVPARRLCRCLQRALTACGCRAALYSTVQHRAVPYSITQHCTAPYSCVRHCTASYSTVQHHTAPYSTVQHPTALYGSIRHRTALYSIIQHRAVPCSTVQPRMLLFTTAQPMRSRRGASAESLTSLPALPLAAAVSSGGSIRAPPGAGTGTKPPRFGV